MNHLFQHIQGHLYGAFRPRLLPTGGGTAWSPLSLFAASEQGAWYDPSDFSTMFQDSAGTTPVTAVEQPVGLILDKRLGMALGAEKVPSPLDGIGSASFTIGTSTITRSGSTGTATLWCSAPNLVEGRTYLITYTVSGHSGDSWGVRCAGSITAYGPFTGDGTFSLRAVAGAAVATTITFLPWAGAAGTATFSNISVREIPGNHATQPTAAARPVVSARKNWATYSNDITNAVWNAFGGATKTATGITFAGSAGESLTQLAEPAGGTSGITSTVSMTVSCASGTVGFRIKNTHSAVSDYFGPELVATTTPTRVSFTQVFGASAGNGLIGAGVWNSATSPNSGTLIITDVQVELGSTATRYQRVTTASDYDTVGFPHYVDYDGIDDELSTTFPDLGTDATMARAVPGVGASILTGQTIGAGTWTDSTNHAGLVIIDRALTAGETAALTAYLNAKAGV